MNARPDLSEFSSEHGVFHRAGRAAWAVVWGLFFRPTPRVLHSWRRGLLRAFGARLGTRVRVYPSARVWAPWNLEVGDFSVLGDRVEIYCVAPIRIGSHVVVSQGAHLCAATHDVRDPGFRLDARPIVVEDGAWVAAEAFVGPGVTVGAAAVVGARAVVTRDVPEREIVAGNPARRIGRRELRTESPSA